MKPIPIEGQSAQREYSKLDLFSANAGCRSSLDRVNYRRPLCGMLLPLRYSRYDNHVVGLLAA